MRKSGEVFFNFFGSMRWLSLYIEMNGTSYWTLGVLVCSDSQDSQLVLEPNGEKCRNKKYKCFLTLAPPTSSWQPTKAGQCGCRTLSSSFCFSFNSDDPHRSAAMCCKATRPGSIRCWRRGSGSKRRGSEEWVWLPRRGRRVGKSCTGNCDRNTTSWTGSGS